MIIEIKDKKTGNCPCVNCGKMQEGWKSHPYTVWHRGEKEKYGHNEPVCSIKCAEELAGKLKGEEI